MNIDQFSERFIHLRDVDRIDVDPICDHPEHINAGKQIGKGPAKRNILKHGGTHFICRACDMRHNNPMTKAGDGRRQSDEEITVHCPHPEHVGDPARKMKKACYYGEIVEPYLQVCGSCAQRGKVISDEQRDKTCLALKGKPKSDEFKANLSEYMKTNPEGIARATKNLVENRCTSGMLGKLHSEETKRRMSESPTGIQFTDEHCRHISEGRKKMLAAQGGFTQEHWENIWKANASRRSQQNADSFDDHHHKEQNRKRAKKHYDERIASDVEITYCSFCDSFHCILRKTYEANIARNGRYVCGWEGGHIAGSKPKPTLRKANPYAEREMKECSNCHEVMAFDEFHRDRTRSDGRCSKCKGCRAGQSG